MNYNLEEVAETINNLMYEKDPSIAESLGIDVAYITNGWVQMLRLNDIELFSSESDNSDYYIEESDEYVTQDKFQLMIIDKIRIIAHKLINCFNE